MAAVEPELLELLCVLLDADLHFDLSSNKFPHYIGGAAAGMLHEVPDGRRGGVLEEMRGGG